MKQIKKLFDFYIQSSIHVSLCFVAFYVVVAMYGGFLPTFTELIAVGTSTLAGYNVAKYIHLLRLPFQFHFIIKIVTVICSIVAIVAVFMMGFYAVLLFSFCTVLTGLYSLPVILGRSFRQIPVLKLITIGVSWSLLAVILPRIMEHPVTIEDSNLSLIYENWNGNFVLLAIFEYSLFVIALCIPFEIRDLKYDSPQLRTLPQLTGVKNSKFVGFALLIICALIEFVLHQEDPLQAITTLIILVITTIAIAIAGKFKTDYYSSFFVESIPILWLGIYLMLNS